MDASELIDRLIDDRVVVFGSLPPKGRDIDIVAREAQLMTLDRGLRAEGFSGSGDSLVRFGDCGVEAVELVPISDWGLTDEASRDLFLLAIPLEGKVNLCRPSPAHAILIAGRRLAGERGAAAGKARAHFASALAEQPGALAFALAQSPAWGVKPAVEALLGGQSRLRLVTRLRSLHRRRRRQGSGWWNSVLWTARQQVPSRPRRGALIALSGLDGAGKSTQAAALAESLRRLGFDAQVAWVPMAQGPWLGRVASTLRPWLGPIVSRRARRDATSTSGGGSSPPGRERHSEHEPFLFMSPGLSMLWAVMMALRLVLRTGVVLRVEIWRGRIVICDRYVLDAWTYMRYHYVAAPSLRIQFGLVRLLSPRPLRAFALIVDPETATRRKADFDAVENARRSLYYQEGIERLGVEPLDGGLPQAEICSRIAHEVYGALTRS